MVDALIQSSETIPGGTVITITNPSIGGASYTLPSPRTEIWLSDVLFAQQSAAPRRTKLNTHTTQVFDFTLVPPTGKIATTLTFKVYASDSVPAGGRHGVNAMVSPVLLGQASKAITFEQ